MRWCTWLDWLVARRLSEEEEAEERSRWPPHDLSDPHAQIRVNANPTWVQSSPSFDDAERFNLARNFLEMQQFVGPLGHYLCQLMAWHIDLFFEFYS